jgi:phosphoribosylanthranilate isomerase
MTPHRFPTRTRIKICGLTREEDVDAAVHAGADAVGFVLYAPSPRYVSPQRAAELSRRLPPFVTPVLLFVNESTTNIIAARAVNTWAICQFHGDESPENCLETGLPYLRAARIPLSGAEDFDLVKFSQDYASAQAILVDAHVDGYGGGGKAFNWNAINWSHPLLNASSRLVLSGGLTPANVTDGILQARPWAVDVSSGVECDAPGLPGQTLKGIKDPDKIIQFVAAVRRADELLATQ